VVYAPLSSLPKLLQPHSIRHLTHQKRRFSASPYKKGKNKADSHAQTAFQACRFCLLLCSCSRPICHSTKHIAAKIGSIKRKPAMAAFETTRTAPFGAIATYNVIRFISNVANDVIAWNDARVTRNALGKLSDRELDDIGLSRGDISDIAMKNRFCYLAHMPIYPRVLATLK
jgi:uncharacterized protein YjiS (DUF1127 family)